MAGIYIHIPFCKQKCYYCNFFSIASLKNKDRFLYALKNEIGTRNDYLENEIIDTIYLGGGTPSILDINEIENILISVYKNFTVKSDAEITLEANPDELNREKIFDLKTNTNVNRLSIGIQSFYDDDLSYLHRVHDSKQAKQVIENALKAGFNNLTIDLIYGIPGLTEKKWRNNLQTFFSYKIPHLSSYSLTVEPKTALNFLIKKKKLKNIDENESINHFNILLEETSKHNFTHYEISNFAIEGYYSKHNSTYWLGGKYVGFGPSAHSFNGKSRQWNIKNVEKYCAATKISEIVDEKEILTKYQMYDEYVMTSLRTSWGCNTMHIRDNFGNNFEDYFEKNVKIFLTKNLLTKNGNTYTLTKAGKIMADGIASELFYD